MFSEIVRSEKSFLQWNRLFSEIICLVKSFVQWNRLLGEIGCLQWNRLFSKIACSLFCEIVLWRKSFDGNQGHKKISDGLTLFDIPVRAESPWTIIIFTFPGVPLYSLHAFEFANFFVSFVQEMIPSYILISISYLIIYLCQIYKFLRIKNSRNLSHKQRTTRIFTKNIHALKGTVFVISSDLPFQ